MSLRTPGRVVGPGADLLRRGDVFRGEPETLEVFVGQVEVFF